MYDAARLARLDLYVRLMVGALALWCLLSPLYGGASIDLGGGRLLIASFLVMVVIAYVYRPAGRDIPTFHFLGGMTADLVAYGVVFGLATYVAAGLNRPLVDDVIVTFDRMMRFDWVTYNAFIEARPWLRWAVWVGYFSMMPQLGLLLVVLYIRGEKQKIRLLLNAMAVCAALAIILSGIFPAMVAQAYFGMLTPDTPASAGIPGPSYFPYIEMTAIRSGEMSVFRLGSTTGIVAFPSFHTMTGVLLAIFAWHIGWLRWPAVALNALLILGTPVDGGHYLTDVVVGFVLAVLVVRTLEGWVRAPALAAASDGMQALPQPATS